MAYDINAALERLEQNLQDLDSARKQVEKTVAASSELQDAVNGYVSSVKTLCVGLQTWDAKLKTHGETLSHEYETAISRVNSTCTNIISSFGTEVEKTSTDFKNRTKPVVEKFTEQIGELDKHVKNLNALKDEIKKATSEIQVVKDSLTQISKDLKESQESQDADLKDLKQKSDEIIGKAESITEKIESLHEKADSIKSLLSKVNSLGKEIKTGTEKIHSNLQSVSETLLNAITDSKNETTKAININRWIVIVGIILLIALHFIK